MTGQTLALDATFLEAPTRLHLLTIEAMMLWPHDAERREVALVAGSIEALREIKDQLPREELEALTDLLCVSQRVSDLRGEAERAIIDGLRAGQFLIEVIGQVRLGLNPKMELVADQVCAALGLFADAVSGRSFRSHVWPKYRPVAHLWAATQSLHGDANISAFPCDLGEIIDFLALAEGYRELGEQARTHQAPAPILIPGEAVMLPPEFGITPNMPAFELRSGLAQSRRHRS
jgi:hypothetical protein